MADRFAILHHTGHGREHWDLMLEHRGVLATWRLFREPTGRDALPIRARRIGDHRRAYLEYEGPVSGDRGEVRRVDAGAVEIEEFTPDACSFTLSGGRLTGRFALTRRVDDEWSLAGDYSGL